MERFRGLADPITKDMNVPLSPGNTESQKPGFVFYRALRPRPRERKDWHKGGSGGSRIIVA